METPVSSGRWRVFLTGAGAVLLTVLSGCALAKNEEDGDQEPVQVEYRVNIEPSILTVSPSAPKVTLDLTAGCAGDHQPAGCVAGFDPGWQPFGGSVGSSGFPDSPRVFIDIANAASQTTAAELEVPERVFTAMANPVVQDRYLFLGIPPVLVAGIVPSRVPEGTVLTGKRSIDITVDVPPPAGGVRSEGDADKSRLTVFPVTVNIRTAIAPTELATVSYRGPSIFLTEVSVDGADAGRFSVGVPALPMVLENRTATTLNITFLGGEPSREYYADVTLHTDTGVTRRFRVTAST